MLTWMHLGDLHPSDDHRGEGLARGGALIAGGRTAKAALRGIGVAKVRLGARAADGAGDSDGVRCGAPESAERKRRRGDLVDPLRALGAWPERGLPLTPLGADNSGQTR
jgi:hypothetical protein